MVISIIHFFGTRVYCFANLILSLFELIILLPMHSGPIDTFSSSHKKRLMDKLWAQELMCARIFHENMIAIL